MIPIRDKVLRIPTTIIRFQRWIYPWRKRMSDFPLPEPMAIPAEEPQQSETVDDEPPVPSGPEQVTTESEQDPFA